MTPENDPPTLSLVSYEAVEDTPATFVFHATPGPGETRRDALLTLQARPVNWNRNIWNVLPAFGLSSVSLTDGVAEFRVTMTPHANRNGPATVGWRALDGEGATVVLTETVNIAAVDDAPVVRNLGAGTIAYPEDIGVATVCIDPVPSCLLYTSDAADE